MSRLNWNELYNNIARLSQKKANRNTARSLSKISDAIRGQEMHIGYTVYLSFAFDELQNLVESLLPENNARPHEK